MARQKIKPLHAWETAQLEKGPEKGYIRLSQSLLQHPAFKALTQGERMVYITMVAACAGRNQFSIPRASYEEKFGIPHNNFWRAVKKLEQAGFIQVKQSGKNTRTPNVYQFVDTWKKAARPP